MLFIQENFKIIKFLVEKWADINTKNKTGETALNIAVCKYNRIIVEYLLKKISDINVKNNKVFTVLNYAAFKPKPNIGNDEKTDKISLLRQASAKLSIKLK